MFILYVIVDVFSGKVDVFLVYIEKEFIFFVGDVVDIFYKVN